MLFAIGSLCFFLGPLPGFVQLVGSAADGTVFFVGVLFGSSTIASYVVPATGDVLSLAAANVSTSLGALCFLIGAVMLLPQPADVRPVAATDRTAAGEAAR